MGDSSGVGPLLLLFILGSTFQISEAIVLSQRLGKKGEKKDVFVLNTIENEIGCVEDDLGDGWFIFERYGYINDLFHKSMLLLSARKRLNVKKYGLFGSRKVMKILSISIIFPTEGRLQNRSGNLWMLMVSWLWIWTRLRKGMSPISPTYITIQRLPIIRIS